MMIFEFTIIFSWSRLTAKMAVKCGKGSSEETDKHVPIINNEDSESGDWQDLSNFPTNGETESCDDCYVVSTQEIIDFTQSLLTTHPELVNDLLNGFDGQLSRDLLRRLRIGDQAASQTILNQFSAMSIDVRNEFMGRLILVDPDWDDGGAATREFLSGS